MGLLSGLDPQWGWLALGLLLAGAEILVPGVFLIWMALAALIVGLLSWVMPLSMPVQVVLFVVLSLAAVFVSRRYLRANPIEAADPLMNNRGGRLVGEIGKVTQAIEDGSGRIHIGDTEWIAHGADVPVGTRVRVTGSNGAILLVEPASLRTDGGSVPKGDGAVPEN
jgi:membrane protein implicated in regulation of membrane protease activity